MRTAKATKTLRDHIPVPSVSSSEVQAIDYLAAYAGKTETIAVSVSKKLLAEAKSILGNETLSHFVAVAIAREVLARHSRDYLTEAEIRVGRFDEQHIESIIDLLKS